jgi:hypothetical protein
MVLVRFRLPICSWKVCDAWKKSKCANGENKKEEGKA